MKYEETPCKGKDCNSHYIANKHFWLCDKHNKIRLGAKTPLNKIRTTLKKKKSTYVYKRKITGERALFIEIWNERIEEDGTRRCVSCNDPLGEEPYTYNFSHKKAKSLSKKGRLKKENIDLSCFTCHFEHEHVSKQNRKKNI